MGNIVEVQNQQDEREGGYKRLSERVSHFRFIKNGSHSITPHQHNKFAFTLAEVLISLGIIGIVAALTIPALVMQNQQKAWDTAANLFERRLKSALQTMNTQLTLSGYKTTEDFVNELSKHLNITKICTNDDLKSCFEDTVYFGVGDSEPEEINIDEIKTARHFGQKTWMTNVVGVQLNNGSNGLIAYNPECKEDPYNNQYNPTSCIAILYDTSGFTKPNTSSKDLRALNVLKLGKTCAFKLGETCFGSPFSPNGMSYATCTGSKDATPNTTANAGTYAKSLGIKQCYHDDDRWAGAVEACGGIDNMPTQEDLDKLAKYLYPDIATIATSGYSVCPNATRCMSEEAVNLGFVSSTSSYLYIWSGIENSRYSYTRIFNPSSTSRHIYSRDNTTQVAICLGD